MPNRREHDHLVSKMVALGVSRTEAERIVSGLSPAQVSSALKDARALRAIIDMDSRNR
jgi:hypothetical protein